MNTPVIDYYGRVRPKKDSPPKHVLAVVRKLKEFTGNTIAVDEETEAPKVSQRFHKSKIYDLAPELVGGCGCSNMHTLFQHHFTKRGDIRDDSELRAFSPKLLGINTHVWDFLNNVDSHC